MSGSADPFAWLGLLQWSLKYSDGTHPSSDDNVTPMNAEDKAFLEMVMKEGIINENERMKTILYQVTQQIEIWKTQSATDLNAATHMDDSSVDTVYDLLQELRDIVEQIDFARAFMSMKGITFLLGCIENKENIFLPMNIRQLSCAIIATLCQHNPPVQKECIELGAIKILYQLLDQFTNQEDGTDEVDDERRKSNTLFCERIIQAISAIVRSYDLAESIFCQLEQANDIFRLGFMGAHDSNNDATTVEPQEQSPRVPPLNVRKRTLFFLRALITSDTTSIQRIQLFQSHIVSVIDHVLLPFNESDTTAQSDAIHTTNVDDEIIEMALGMIQQLLEQRISVNAVLSRKHPLAATAVRRISILRKQQGSTQHDIVTVEVESWERVLSLLADAKPDPPIPPVNE